MTLALDNPALTLTDVQEAAQRIAPHIRHTPLQPSPDLSALAGRMLLLKLENLQRTGAFKIRGALNKLLMMNPAVAAHGVLTASAGNHGQGVALAAHLLGYPATIVLPMGVSLAKLEAIERQGAQTVLFGAAYDEAARYAHALAEERGMTYVHAFDDPQVIAGQGTIALEMLADAPDLDTLVVPVGGGGLLAGIATAARALKPSLTIVGVQGLLPASSQNVGVLISGGNVDPNLLDKCIQTGLASAGRFLAFKTWLPDQPGALHTLTGVLTEARINILHVEIQRIGPYTAIGPVGLEMIVETRNADHAAQVVATLRAAGYPVEVVMTRTNDHGTTR
ncbi:MAG: pyridoxal-phosphate dependent enzyme [Thermomicrobia bacterium]|nr:pyridoxal-phosphate dependent enzyme [Thermomicrobia bacterium]